MKEKRKVRKRVEYKKQFCFTLYPSIMHKVEKLAEKDSLSVSAKVLAILSEHVSK